MLFGMRRVAATVLIAAGAKDVKEEKIIHLDWDDEERERLIKEVGFL